MLKAGPGLSLLDDARRLWTTLAGEPVTFGDRGLRVVVSPGSRLCPPGWVGVVCLDGAAIATAPDERQADRLRQTWTDFDAILDALTWVDVLGPASLAYLSTADLRPVAGPVDQGGDLEPLYVAAGEADVDESGLTDITSAAFTVTEAGAVVAAAGYRDWLGQAAHVSVLTAPAFRGRGLATAVASAAVADALDHGLLPQWRARVEESRRIARTLGFVELGAQVSLRLAES
jgi:GNAT superfamily N-acetyltransferase